MKVSIGSKIVEGPWGGGNLFAINLSEYLLSNGDQVIYDLSDPDIDLILLTDPRNRSESSSTFNHIEIEKYLKYVNPNAVVVQRINECDERKNTKNINEFYLAASDISDHVIFVSEWLRNIYVQIGMDKEKTSVVYAGASSEIFNEKGKVTLTNKSKVKLVTHHWSSHVNKGFKIYKYIDNLLEDKNWSEKLDFTYIGNLSEEYPLLNSNTISPLSGIELAAEIKKHHIYITGSINEPSGNHHIEASQCGLPIMYIDSGGIPEYCSEYGVSFTEDTFKEKLNFILENMDVLEGKINNYPHNSEKMCSEFYSLFNELISKKQDTNFKYKIKSIGKYYLLKNKMLNRFRFVLNIKNNLTTLLKPRKRV
jgi:hypothetical protein